MLQNEHLVAKIGVDTAENAPIFGQIRFSAGLSIAPQYRSSVYWEAADEELQAEAAYPRARFMTGGGYRLLA